MPFSPRLSVIMPTYNRSTTVRRAINSILVQIFSDFEFIIVDDSSTDDTPKILLECASRDERIVILRQEKNQGQAAARNLGVNKARGKYIAFMDDDDVSLPLRFEKQVAFLDNNPKYQACTCVWKNINFSSQSFKLDEILESPVAMKEGKRIKFKPYRKSHLRSIKLPFVLGNMAAFTRESFIECGGQRISGKIFDDLDLTFRFLEKFQAALLIEVLYYYTVPESNFRNNVTTQYPIITIKKYIVSYISAWYRLTNRPDPVEKDLSLDEVCQLIHQLPPKNRVVIYASISGMYVYVQQLNKCSRKEAIRLIMEMSGVTKLPILLYCRVLFVNYKLYCFKKLKQLFIHKQ